MALVGTWLKKYCSCSWLTLIHICSKLLDLKFSNPKMSTRRTGQHQQTAAARFHQEQGVEVAVKKKRGGMETRQRLTKHADFISRRFALRGAGTSAWQQQRAIGWATHRDPREAQGMTWEGTAATHANASAASALATAFR